MPTDYCKYACWTDGRGAAQLKAKLAARNIPVVEARKAVCVPMSKRIDVGIVPPDTWRKTELCKRPLSWYWISPLAGRYLVVSAFPLTEFGFTPHIVLRKIKFRPPSMPGDAKKSALIRRDSYLHGKPYQWDDLDGEDPARQDRWMKVMGIRGKTFRELFLTHCANHANFIEPEYFVENGEGKIPYSIGKTNQVCSACLEFFGVIGGRFPKRLVVPCPGASIFAGLPVNRYLEAETIAGSGFRRMLG